MAAARPTHVNRLILHTPGYMGLIDASSWGAAGVWFSGTHHLEPFVWFVQWPLAITTALCSKNNLTGHLSICNLKLEGVVLHVLALTTYICCYDTTLCHRTAAIWCDNLATVHWTYKFQTSTSHVSAKILCALAIHTWQQEAVLLDV